MKNLEKQVQALLEEIASYNLSPNKSKSARVRAKLGQLKKDVTGIRSKLVEADKAGY